MKILNALYRFWKNRIVQIVAACSLVAKVTSWMLNSAYETNLNRTKAEHEREVQKIEQRQNSITRRLGDSEYLDVRKLVVDRLAGNPAPHTSGFFPKDAFYATTNSTIWKYAQMTANDASKALAGLEVDPNLKDAWGRGYFHVWLKDSPVKVSGSSVLSNVVTAILVKKIERKDIDDGFGFQSTQTTIRTENGAFLTNSVSKLFPLAGRTHHDPVGVILASGLSTLFLSTTLMEDEMQGDLISMQKLGNVLYGQFQFTFKNITIAGSKYEIFFYTFDTVVINTEQHVYLVLALIPSEDPSLRVAMANTPGPNLPPTSIILKGNITSPFLIP
jgi:hypothetical protein